MDLNFVRTASFTILTGIRQEAVTVQRIAACALEDRAVTGAQHQIEAEAVPLHAVFRWKLLAVTLSG